VHRLKLKSLWPQSQGWKLLSSFCATAFQSFSDCSMGIMVSLRPWMRRTGQRRSLTIASFLHSGLTSCLATRPNRCPATSGKFA